MQNLTAASRELFRRSPDEVFESLDSLYERCVNDKQRSQDRWHAPLEIRPKPIEGRLDLELGADGVYRMNDWSFSQLCKFSGVSKDTLNKLSPETAGQALLETFPGTGKPLQVLSFDRQIRSIHGASYMRLHNLDLLNIVREFATDFQPPQKSKFNNGTGLYCGEQDMFVFLIDPLGWADINGEAFAPGFFLWNSEVGRRSVGIQTFWFQAVCANHIVWDAVEVVDFSRKHTANVHECLSEIRRHIERLVEKRDERRDGFARVMANAFKTELGDKADDVAKVLAKHGIPRDLGRQALQLAEQTGRFTVFTLVDALSPNQPPPAPDTPTGVVAAVPAALDAVAPAGSAPSKPLQVDYFPNMLVSGTPRDSRQRGNPIAGRSDPDGLHQRGGCARGSTRLLDLPRN